MRRSRFFAVPAVVFMLIVGVTIWYPSASDPEKDVQKRELSNTKVPENKTYMTFDEWVSGKFYAKSFYPNWVSGSEYITKTGIKLVKINIADGTETTLIDDLSNIEDLYTYDVSADGQFVAILYSQTDGYAHYVKTFSIKIFQLLDGTELAVAGLPNNKIQKLKWSPSGHKLAYVYEFDVYVYTDFSKQPVQLSNDGQENVVFNGITDWLHYVEITDDDALIWWSPDDKYLTFAKLDQTNVKLFDFSLNGAYSNQYPQMIKFPYPKPGTPIPKTTLYVYDTEGMEDAKLFTPSQAVLDWDDFYLNSLMWRSNQDFIPTWKSRFQNESISDSCFAKDESSCSHVDSEGMVRSSNTGWLGTYKPADLIQGLSDDEVMTIYSNNKFPHIAVINMTTGAVDYRTDGQFEVTNLFHYDVTNDWVYFLSTEMNDGSKIGLPRIRHMWRVKAHENDMTRECITCDLNTIYTDRCNWVYPSFSTTGEYVVVNCGGTGNGVPVSTLHKINNAGQIEFAAVQENNDNLLNLFEEYYFRERIYGNLILPGVEDVWYYALHLPPNFDESKKYPLFVQVYSGPGYQYVVDAYNTDWARGYIASSDLDIVVMTFDGRGTGYRGDEILHMVYRQLGKLEPEDQIEAARQVLGKYPYLDKQKVAIWGRSYGGYATTRIIQEDKENVFKCGFAVAPVIDWMFYHTIYTERFMASPFNDNEVGYNQSTALQKYDTIKQHRFYLVHGTGDENVHFQNSARMSMALIEHDVDFGAYFAADEVHSFNRGSNAYAHHYKLLTRHLKECFGIL